MLFVSVQLLNSETTPTMLRACADMPMLRPTCPTRLDSFAALGWSGLHWLAMPNCHNHEIVIPWSLPDITLSNFVLYRKSNTLPSEVVILVDLITVDTAVLYLWYYP